MGPGLDPLTTNFEGPIGSEELKMNLKRKAKGVGRNKWWLRIQEEVDISIF